MPVTNICPSCQQRRDQGCNGFQINAHRYGQEPHWQDTDDLEPLPNCADCAAPIGSHHHANCLQARCMICGDQAVCCDHARENGNVIGPRTGGGG